MAICNRLGNGCSNTMSASATIGSSCPDVYGCPSDVCPDFTIKRHDTLPVFKVSVEDCDGPLDLEGTQIVAEVNMWANGKLKYALTEHSTTLSLTDNIGFYQVKVGDIIMMDRVRSVEYMLVTHISETTKEITITRGYNNSAISSWPRGNKLRIFKILNAPASIELVKRDEEAVDGTVTENVLTATYLIYNWTSNDTCMPGCYWLEFKVFKELLLDNIYDPTPNAVPVVIGEDTVITEDLIDIRPDDIPSVPSVPSHISMTPCEQPTFEWVRRFPQGEGFLIKITDSYTLG